MKHLITMLRLFFIFLVALSLVGCGYVKVRTDPWVDEAGQQRGGINISTFTLWKEIYAAEAHSENLILRLNRSAIDSKATEMISAICSAYPELCQSTAN